MSRSIFLLRARAFAARHRSLLWVFALALVVRLVWNLAVHPPSDYLYSDMGGYAERANRMIDKPWKPAPYLTLFPYGTHVFIYVVKILFGRDNRAALGVAFAMLGALAVAFTYATMERLSASRGARVFAGAVLVLYYPWISLGGYTLSETPFTFCLAGAALFGLRVVDRGRALDAWIFGAFLALGAAVRPQILVSLVFFALHMALRKSAYKRFSWGLLARAIVPVALVLGASSIRTHWHTGKLGLVSTNGPLNFAFGRCHAVSISSRARDGSGFFGPPSLGALHAFERKYPALTPIGLDPIFGPSVTYNGRMWEAEPTYALARACVQKSGLARQLKYAFTHVILLWGYNTIWPDQGQKPKFRIPMGIASGAHNLVILPPAALALVLAFRRRRARDMALALHVWALVVMAVAYFGDTRYRAPYDGVLIVLAASRLAPFVGWVMRRVRDVIMRAQRPNASMGIHQHP